MAFTTGGQLLPHHSRFQRKSEEVSFLKDRIDDLESALQYNTSLLLDITSSKAASAHRAPDQSQDTDVFLLFPGTCFKKLLDQQDRMRAILTKFAGDIHEAREREGQFERQVEDLKAMELRNLRDLALEVREMKRVVQEKERFVQALEKELGGLEAEKAFIHRGRDEGLNPQLSIQKVRKLIKEVTIEVGRNEREKELLKGKCFVPLT